MDRNRKSRFVLAGIVIGLIFLCFIVDRLFFREQRRMDQAEANARRITSSIAEKISEVILSYESIAEEASNTLNNSDTSLLDIRELLGDIVQYNDNVNGCGIAYLPDSLTNGIALGIKYCNKEGGKKNYYDLTDKEATSVYYQIKAIVEKEPLLLDETMASLDKEVGACYFTPIYAYGKHSEKVCAGILGLELNKEWFSNFIESASAINRDHMFLINYKGNFLYYPRRGILRGKNIQEVAKNYKSKELEEVACRMLRGESGLVKYTPLFRKEKFLLYFTPVPKVKCYVGILFPENELLD